MPSFVQASSPEAWKVADDRAAGEPERADRDRRRHRLVDVEQVEVLALERTFASAARCAG